MEEIDAGAVSVILDTFNKGQRSEVKNILLKGMVLTQRIFEFNTQLIPRIIWSQARAYLGLLGAQLNVYLESFAFLSSIIECYPNQAELTKLENADESSSLPALISQLIEVSSFLGSQKLLDKFDQKVEQQLINYSEFIKSLK